MNPYLLDPNICPASLDENNEPTNPSGSAHRWDEDTNPVTCAECGAEKPKECQCGALVDLNGYAINEPKDCEEGAKDGFLCTYGCKTCFCNRH